MSDNNKRLDTLRNTIDSLDTEILTLITKRAECIKDISTAKQQSHEKATYYRPEREAQVLRKMMEKNAGPLEDKAIAKIFRCIMSSSLALQQPITAAFLGPEGTFSQAAALKHFGPAMIGAPQQSIKNIFKYLTTHSTQYGVVPIENSTEGTVNQTFDLLRETPLKICGEVSIPVHLKLLTNPSFTAPITKIYAHQQAIAQCRDWLDINWPNAERITVSSNGFAAQRAQNETGCAAIAGELAAELYGLKTYAENIEDHLNNLTRFLVLGHQDTPPSGHDKTSLLVTMANKTGALATLIATFAKHKLSISLFETRPERSQAWNYVFFIDIEAHILDKPLGLALSELESQSFAIKHLGSYPKAVL